MLSGSFLHCNRIAGISGEIWGAAARALPPGSSQRIGSCRLPVHQATLQRLKFDLALLPIPLKASINFNIHGTVVQTFRIRQRSFVNESEPLGDRPTAQIVACTAN